MNRIEKLLNKLDPKTRRLIEQAIYDLTRGNLNDFKLKKIKGTKDIFRVRVGKYRIIFRVGDNQINLIAVTKRDDQTYRDF